MRYTRYEYKKSGNFKFILSVIVVAALSLGGGMYVSNALFGNGKVTDKTIDGSSLEQNVGKSHTGTIVAIQCGFYSKKENADALVTEINKYCHPFIVDKDGSYRVIAGIYNEEDSQKKIQELQEKGVEVAKTTTIINADTSDNKKIIEISDGFLKIMSKLEDADVNGIKTSEFKNWCSNIIDEGGHAQDDKLKKISKYVQDLPDEINKNNNSELSCQFYKLINE